MVGSSIGDNLVEVKERIATAARRSGRQASDIRLIAVSKTKPLDLIDVAARAGQKEFGENYVQEAIAKVAARPDLVWHFIGSLQTNKVKDVVGHFRLIHSVDRDKLAREISKVASRSGLTQDILLQIHIGEESSKHGASSAEVDTLVREIVRMPGLRLRGVMSLPPLSEDERVSRGYFRQTRELAEHLRRDVLTPEQASVFNTLSMGTSSDYEWAILEGATHVRVGTSIFGAREYKNS